MARTKPILYHQAFRFGIDLYKDGEKLPPIGLARVKWDGPHLVLTRGMQVGAPSLYEDLKKVEEHRVFLYDREDWRKGTVSRTWTIRHEGIMNRGFLFMDAMEDTVALEAVCLLFATMEEII